MYPNPICPISYLRVGYGAGGRLGIGGSDSVCHPTLLESIQHVCIKTVSFLFIIGNKVLPEAWRISIIFYSVCIYRLR